MKLKQNQSFETVLKLLRFSFIRYADSFRPPFKNVH